MILSTSFVKKLYILVNEHFRIKNPYEQNMACTKSDPHLIVYIHINLKVNLKLPYDIQAVIPNRRHALPLIKPQFVCINIKKTHKQIYSHRKKRASILAKRTVSKIA